MPSVPELIVIDVGNTRTKFARMTACSAAEAAADAPTRPHELPRCEDFLAVEHGSAIPWDALHRWQESSPHSPRTVISGGRPQKIAELQEAWLANFGTRPEFLGDYRRLPLHVATARPETVGIDRLLNAVAANRIRKPRQAVIIVDSGTATTVDALSADGRFLGGAILPGLQLAAHALHDYTELLPFVPVSELAASVARDDFPEVIGRDTRAAIYSGLFWGQLGAVRELVTRTADRLVHAAQESAAVVHRPDAKHIETRPPAQEARRDVSAPPPAGFPAVSNISNASNPPNAAASVSKPPAAPRTVSDLSPPPLILVTGGGGSVLAPLLTGASYEQALALQGLALAAIVQT